MLVIDLDTLQTVDVLHLIRDIPRELLDTLEAQNIVRISRAVDDDFTLVHDLAIVRHDVFFLWDQILVSNTVQIRYDQTLLALGIFAKRHSAGNLCQQTCILWRARLEQFRDTWQTASDVTRFRSFLRNPSQHLANRHVLTILDGDNAADLKSDIDRQLGPSNLDFHT